MIKKIVISGSSDPGSRRETNEDAFLIAGMVERNGSIDLELSSDSLYFNEHGLLCAVADGMGGHKGGDYASKFVLERFTALHCRLMPNHMMEPSAAIREAVEEIHSALCQQAKVEPTFSGMGSTVVGVLITSQKCVVFNVGDSRVYRLRGQHLLQLTRDHSLSVPVDDVSGEVMKTNLITNSIGGGEGLDCEIDLDEEVAFIDGDSIILCTDGLYGSVDKSDMLSIFSEVEEPHERVRELIAAGKRNNAADNLTAVIVHFIGDPFRG